MTTNEAKEYLNKHLKDSYYANKMLDESNKYCNIADLAMRFVEVNKERNNAAIISPHYDYTNWNPNWNLEQILTNIRMTPYSKKEDIVKDYKAKIRAEVIEEIENIMNGDYTVSVCIGKIEEWLKENHEN